MAGRQIKPFKGANGLYDAGHGHVYAEKIQPLPDNLRKKILQILEAFPSKSKSEIAEVLQACDYDVTKALNCFVADGGMEGQNEWMVQGKQNEWMVQGKRKKKKKKSGKKGAKDTSDSQSQNDAEGSATTASVEALASTMEKQTEAGQKKVLQNIPTETAAEGQPTDKPTRTNNENPTSLANLKPESNDVPKSSETTPTQTSPLVSSPLLSPPLISPTSPTDSLSSSQDLQMLNKSRTGSSSNEKHPRQRTTSGSGSDVFKKTLKDLQRSAISISRYQSMLDEQAEISTKMLAKSFQAIRQTLDEREKYLEEQLQSVTEEAKKLLEERQEDAAVLKFKCNRIGMSDEETNDLRNEIKHFVGERKIDEDIGKIILFLCDEEQMLETVRNFGEVPPIKHHYTSYQRKHPEPSKPVSRKPPPVKTTTAPSSTSTTAPANVTTTSTSNEVKNSNSRNERRQVLSPAGLKDQAEMHARLQQAVKQQQVPPVSKEGTKQSDRNATEKTKPKDFGSKSNRNNNSSKEQQSRREQTSQRQRQTSSSQNSTKSFGKRNENKPTNSENSKTPVQSNDAKAKDGSPADGESQAEDGIPEENGTPGKDGSLADDHTKAQANKPAGSSHVPENHGDRKTKRRYIRKTPVGDGSPVFRTGTVKASNNSSLIQNGDQSKVKSSDLPNGKMQRPITNGTNGFVPLPQRNRKPRRYYLKKEPGSKIEFPPSRENGSVPA